MFRKSSWSGPRLLLEESTAGSTLRSVSQRRALSFCSMTWMVWVWQGLFYRSKARCRTDASFPSNTSLFADVYSSLPTLLGCGTLMRPLLENPWQDYPPSMPPWFDGSLAKWESIRITQVRGLGFIQFPLHQCGKFRSTSEVKKMV